MRHGNQTDRSRRALTSRELAVDEASSRLLERELTRRWEAYLGAGRLEHARGPIAESWHRSLAAGVDPFESRAPTLLADRGEVRERWEADPLGTGAPLIQRWLRRFAEESDYGILVSDGHGMLLWVHGVARLRSEVADARNTVEGALWSESGVGTSAVGTALAAGCPVHVRAAEHFSEPVHLDPEHLGRRRPSSGRVARLSLEEGDDGEHAAMIVCGLRERELAEDASDVLMDGALANPQLAGDPRVRAALRHQLENLALARRQLAERIVDTARRDQLFHQPRVDDRPAAGDPLEGLEKLADLSDPALEQVSDPAPLREQVHRAMHLDMRGQDEDSDLGELCADRLRGIETLGRMRGGHPNVQDDELRDVLADEPHQLGHIAGEADNDKARRFEQAGDALAQEDIVVCDHHAKASHGWGRHFVIASCNAEVINILSAATETSPKVASRVIGSR